MSKFLKVSGITVAVGAALYAGLGYFGVPYVARTVLERFGSTELGRTVAVRRARGTFSRSTNSRWTQAAPRSPTWRPSSRR